MENTRPNKQIYYLNVAETISMRSTCMKNAVGVVIVKNDIIISTGYNGAPRGQKNCIDIGECYRIKHNIPSGERYEMCRAIHGEMNAIIAASRESMINSTMYLYQYDKLNHRVRTNPGVCLMCRRAIINAGIEQVVFADPDGIGATYSKFGYRIKQVQDWVTDENDDPISGGD